MICSIIIYNYSAAGVITTNANLHAHTIPAYDCSVYVSDGHTEVGPRTLTIVIGGKYVPGPYNMVVLSDYVDRFYEK